MSLTPKKLIKLLKENGYIIVGQNGSHVKLHNGTTGRQTIVPMHSQCIKKGIEQAILSQAGLKKG